MGATSLLGRMPNRGNNTKGNKAVTAREVPSPIHQMAMRAVTASIRCPSGVKPCGVGMKRIIQNVASPARRTIPCLLNEVANSPPHKIITERF